MDPAVLDTERLPRHVAIIMDGNGRWAKKRSLERIMGHRRGMESVRTAVRTCRELGIGALTLYAFSTENWSRPAAEVNALMALLKRYIRSEISDLHRNGIRVRVIGDIARLPDDIRQLIGESVTRTVANDGMVLNVALSYSGRDEIVRAVRGLARRVALGELDPDDISEAVLAAGLDTAGIADPDLLIRTSGELRISNFLLWQLAYTEIYVTDVLWPDFGRDELQRALIDYQQRVRRFGRTDEQLHAGRVAGTTSIS